MVWLRDERSGIETFGVSGFACHRSCSLVNLEKVERTLRPYSIGVTDLQLRLRRSRCAWFRRQPIRFGVAHYPKNMVVSAVSAERKNISTQNFFV